MTSSRPLRKSDDDGRVTIIKPMSVGPTEFGCDGLFIYNRLGDVEQNGQVTGGGGEAHPQGHQLPGDAAKGAAQGRRFGCGLACVHSATLVRPKKSRHLQNGRK